MRSRLANIFGSFFAIQKEDRPKFFYLTGCYFFIIAAYTLVQALKDSIFLVIVGEDYLPIATIAAMVVLVPAILFYAWLVDRLRRYQLLLFYSVLYGVLGLVFAYFVGHPVIGLPNTDSSPWRIFGWVFYFFIQGFSPFVVSVFWAFANSVTNPAEAKQNYGVMVAGSKLGGTASAFAGWFLLTYATNNAKDAAVFKHQILIGAASALLLVIPIIISFMIKRVPKKLLHGYEAAYQVEKEKEKTKKKTDNGIMSGLMLLLKQPYVLGIFCMVFFYEAIHVVLNYQRLIFAKKISHGAGELSGSLLFQMGVIHFFGFIIAYFGTTTLLRKFGEARALVLIPSFTGLLIFLYYVTGNMISIGTVFICLKIMNYAVSYPLRESLYIPTVKEVKFKSKAWIDAFGTRFAKGFGGGFNMICANLGLRMFYTVQSIFFAIIVVLWFFAAYLLGKRYQQAIEDNEVIGAPKES